MIKQTGKFLTEEAEGNENSPEDETEVEINPIEMAHKPVLMFTNRRERSDVIFTCTCTDRHAQLLMQPAEIIMQV